ncbi:MULTISPECIES: cytidine deaminase [Haloarcula]|uniref:cytidine deaminase n=1 Tax=Haloarcula TaxID=2237 RepID=UPI0023E7F05B|nr:cytidine deaminase [Halomicroarcula sp. SHR3]
MDDLLEAARDAAEAAYAPYSEYRVGAAIETADGTVYTGCNVENANYSNSLHAEEVAVGTAIREGHQSFARLAVSSAKRDGVTPCGMCRQTLAEFCGEEFPIVTESEAGGEPTEYTLGELLPTTITREHLE